MKIRIDLKILFFLGLFYITGQIKVYLIIMGFALLHELAHLFVGNLLKFKPKEIEVMPLGFNAKMIPTYGDYKIKVKKSNVVEVKKILVASAGPMFNLILVIFLIFLWGITDNTVKTSDNMLILRQTVIYSNFLIFVFNLIPICPLDGGRILQSFLRVFLGRKQADKWANNIANIFMILLTICTSVLILLFRNIAILFVLIYLWYLVVLENKRYEIKKKIYEQ